MDATEASMGKLHKIRKAVEANPEIFKDKFLHEHSDIAWHYARGAKIVDGKVYPTYLPSYKKFVYKVLRDLGYIADPRPKTPIKIKVKFAGVSQPDS